jgi:hypothetical protein
MNKFPAFRVVFNAVYYSGVYMLNKETHETGQDLQSYTETS